MKIKNRDGDSLSIAQHKVFRFISVGIDNGPDRGYGFRVTAEIYLSPPEARKAGATLIRMADEQETKK